MLTEAGGCLDVTSRSFSAEAPASLPHPFPSSLRGPVPSTFAGTLISISVSVFSGFYVRIFLTHSDQGLHEGVDRNLPAPLGPVRKECSGLSGKSSISEGLMWLRGTRLQVLEKQTCSFHLKF